MSERRARGSLMLVLAAAALGLAAYLHLGSRPQPVRPFTLTAGPAETTRALLGEMLVERLKGDGLPASLVEVDETLTELDMIDRDRVNFAELSGALRIEQKAHVRQVAPLYVEALHLLVRPDRRRRRPRDLAALRGPTASTPARPTPPAPAWPRACWRSPASSRRGPASPTATSAARSSWRTSSA
ncbi:MAG: hypothetical protein U0802_01615 [Candidatus Binatia bacterium]